MSDLAFIKAHGTPRIRFDSMPVYNVLCSICLLFQDHLDHISSWVDSTVARMTPEERETAELACDAVQYVPATRAKTLDEFVSALGSIDPARFLALDVSRLHRQAIRRLGPDGIPDETALATDRNTYLELTKRMYEYHDKEFVPEKYERYWDRLHDGERYKTELIDAIKSFWATHMKEEWAHVQPAIDDSVRAFQSVEIEGESIEEKIKFITQRDNVPKSWMEMLEEAEEVVFVPSVHIGPYITMFDFDPHYVVLVGRARIPEGAGVSSPTLDRSDILIRLDALGDATRLRILEMAAARAEITSQDVMEELELSQSSASRHLTQLTATGLLKVDGSERTRRYRLNGRRIEDVCAGLQSLFGAAVRT